MYRIRFKGDDTITEEIVAASVQGGWRLREITMERCSLDVIFAQLSGKLKNNIEFLKLRFDVFNEMLTYNLKYFEGEVLDYYSKQVEKSLRRFNDNYNKLIGGIYYE